MTRTKTKKITPRANPARFYKTVVVSFMSLAIILIIFIVYFSLVLVKITLYAKTDLEQLSGLVSVVETSAAKTTPDALPAYFIDTQESLEGEFASTGKGKVSREELGQVTLVNKLQENQPLLKTTRLLSKDGILLHTRDYVVVPKNGEATVVVYPDTTAESFFEHGNSIPQGEKFTIPGLTESRQIYVYGIGHDVMSYGSTDVHQVSSEDIELAETELSSKINSIVVKGFEEKHEGVKIDTQWVVLISQDVVSFESDHKAGDNADSFKAKLSLRVYGIVFEAEKARAVAHGELEKRVSSQKELVSYDENSLQYSLEHFDAFTSTASMRLGLTGTSSLKLTDELLDTSRIAGKDRHELVQYYGQFENIRQIEISFFPAWVTRVPHQRDKIELTIER